MDSRYKDYIEKKVPTMNENVKLPGPIVTISRECGCSAKRIATKLSKILSGYSYKSETKTDVEWRWISKEIIEESASELHMNSDRIRNVFLSERKTRLEDVKNAFSTDKMYDADDQRVIDTVSNVILDFIYKGNFIIVGRGGVALAHEMPNSLNIKLEAPLEWRINRIMQISNMSKADARDYVLSIDNQRELFVEHIAGRKIISCDYDLVFNYSTLKDDHIVDAVVSILRNRGMI